MAPWAKAPRLLSWPRYARLWKLSRDIAAHYFVDFRHFVVSLSVASFTLLVVSSFPHENPIYLPVLVRFIIIHYLHHGGSRR